VERKWERRIVQGPVRKGKSGAAIERSSLRSSVLRNAAPKPLQVLIGVATGLSCFSACACNEDHRPLGLMTLAVRLLLIN
jgi:hypothetical protein